ncbi:MAG: relaxase/mobilization nuclease domain-containing protein [Sedimenticola sp.]
MLDDLNLDKAGSIVSNKTRDQKPMSRKQMLRVAERLPQAMMKISSYQNGTTRVMATLNYISRDSDLLMESEDGFVFTSSEEVEETINEWSIDFQNRQNSRDTMHMILSTPEGSNRISAHRAIRSFSSEIFSRNHSYMFAIHNDTKHPHGHLIVKMRGHDGEKLNPLKSDLIRWREVFAEKCREQGIAVDASKRSARGVGTKGGRTGTKRASMEAAKRKETIKFHEALKISVKEAFMEIKKTGIFKLKPWEKSAKESTKKYKKMYLDEVKQIDTEAKKSTGEDKERLEMESEKLKKYAESLTEPESLRELSVNHLVSESQSRSSEIER